MAPILMSFRLSRSYSVVKKVVPAVRRQGIGFVLAVLLSMFLALAAQAQTDSSSGTSSTVPTLTIVSSSATATEGDEVTYTVTASSAPSSALPVVVHVRAHGEVMDTRTVAEVLLPAGATTVTLRLEEFTDEIDESPVNVTLTLAGGTGYSVGDPSEATVSIDYPSISGTQATPTPAPAVSPPAAPAGVSISSPTRTSFTVSWTTETGKSYRVEREAAYLFKYRVWQVVADNLSAGSYTESGLPCGLYYLFQVRAKVTGSAYGPGSAAVGFPRSCTSSTDSGARSAGSVRELDQNPPQLRLVTDNPTQTSIQIRLLLYGPSTNPGQYTPLPRGLNPLRVDRSDRGTMNFSGHRKEGPQSEFHWEGLECGSGYYFRAQAYGDGLIYQDGGDVYSFNEIWGPWSDEPPRGLVGGTTRGCPKPQVDVIPLHQRRARLRWNNINGASSYEVRVAKPGEDIGTLVPSGCFASTPGTECNILLDNITGGEGLADLDAGEGYRIRVTVHFTDTSKASQYSDVIIVDSPIRSVNGDSREGKMAVRWNSAGSNAQYTVRWRKISNKETNSHTSENWRPVEWRSSHAGSEYDWDSETTSSHFYDIDNEDRGIVEGEIYAVQLNYTVGSQRYFSARERYAWISNRRGGYRLDGDERIGNFPLGFPLNDPLAPNNKTYAYRICADTFASDETKQNEWIALIEHALEQWELASDGLVMMDHALDENGNRAPCVNYTGVMNAVLAQVGSILAEQIEMGEEEMVNLSDLREFFFNLNITGFSSEEDKKRNEIIMVDLDLQRLTEFKGDELWEFSDYLSLSGCIFEGEACAQTDATGVRILGIDIIVPIVIESSTTDILIRSDRRSNNLSIPSVSFNMCSGPNIEVYEDLVHEAGHALGISDGEFFQSERLKDYIENHPPLVDSVMNYNKVIDSLLLTAPGIEKKDFDEPDCSPHPMDIMAIYALYQTVD